MSTQEILETIKKLPVEDWIRIQSGLAEMLSSEFSEEEVADVAEALREADQDFTQGRVASSAEMRHHFGL